MIGGNTRLFVIAALLGATPALAQENAAISVSIKNSPAYGSAVSVPLKSALLVATPRWDNGAGRTFSGVAVTSSEAAIVLSTLAVTCDNVFDAPQPATDTDLKVVAGVLVIYPATQTSWDATPVGQAFASTADVELDMPKFAAFVSHNKKRPFEKEQTKPQDGQLKLSRRNGQWTANISLRSSKLTLDGSVPLTLCPIAPRTINALNEKRPASEPSLSPLLGFGTMLTAVANYK